MIEIRTEKKKGMWKFNVMAGEKGDLDDYMDSDYEFDTETEAEVAALRWIMSAWHVID